MTIQRQEKSMSASKTATMDRGSGFPGRHLGVSSWVGNSGPLMQALTQIAKAGFAWVEIWADRVHLDPGNGVEDVKRIREVMHELDLSVCSMRLSCTGIRIDSPDK
jgi:sugar phosphate isomerase/epimerase